MELVNLTPHPVVLLDENNKVDKMWMPYNRIVVRVTETIDHKGIEDGIHFHSIKRGNVEIVTEYDTGKETSFPLSERYKIIPMLKNTYYIVSSTVQEVAKKTDFISPFKLVRDDVGCVRGCRGFTKWYGD